MSLSIVVHQHGGPEVLAAEEVEIGAPGRGEVQVRHTAIGLNFIDTYHRSGLYPFDLPATIGMEGAGAVVAVGEGVEDLSVGDRVTYSGPMGSYSEVRNLPADHAIPLPDAIDDRTAAATTLKGLTAYYLLHLTYAVNPGDRVLVLAAAGGMGLILGQWIKALGATAIGCAGGPDKCELARRNGYAHVIDYRSQDYQDAVREITGGQGVDVVYDGVGKDTFESSLACLRPRGMMVSYGNATGTVSIPNLGILARGSYYVCRPTGGSYVTNRTERLEQAAALFAVLQSGAVTPTIGQTFALKDIADAHRAIEARATTGSTVILP